MSLRIKLALLGQPFHRFSVRAPLVGQACLRLLACVALASLGGCEQDEYDEVYDPNQGYANSTWSAYVQCHQECDDQVESCAEELPNEPYCGDWYVACLNSCEDYYGVPEPYVDESWTTTEPWTDDSSGSESGFDTDASTDDLPEAHPACFSMHVNCLGQASSVGEVDACETLFDQCARAEPCEQDCELTCPNPYVEACLGEYAGCMSTATSADLVEVCAANFDVCVTGVDDGGCLPAHDPDAVDSCLQQHALCVECIESDDDLRVCRDIFQDCVDPSTNDPGPPP